MGGGGCHVGPRYHLDASIIGGVGDDGRPLVVGHGNVWS